MFHAMISGGIQGMRAYQVRVEVDVSRGLPCFDIVGSAGREVKEARERVQVALRNGGYNLPVAKIIVNLSPAQIAKEGTGYDLAVAAGLLACMEVWRPEAHPDIAFLGELALNGEIRGIKGVLPIALALRERGIRYLFVAPENEGECREVPDIRLMGVRKLPELEEFLKAEESEWEKMRKGTRQETPGGKERKTKIPDFSDVSGQEVARRAAEVAAAGFHHILFAGAPGAGKTMIAKRIPGILPPMSWEERLEVASIYSIAGKYENGNTGENMQRPFLAPHHTLSPQALAGGGRIPTPGLLSLSHRGVLFLDELPEFPQASLEVLRQPLEEKRVQIARSRGTYVYPADFMLVCAMNPCPCGFFPDKNRCTCTEPEIRRYLGKLSGPILDRIDIVTEVSPVRMQELSGGGEPTEKIRERVMKARDRQALRYQGTCYRFNSELAGRDVERFCGTDEEGRRFLEKTFESGHMSVRAYHKVQKLARTIADLEGDAKIRKPHLAEAVFYNEARGRFWK